MTCAKHKRPSWRCDGCAAEIERKAKDGTERDRAEFVALIREAKPGMISRALP